MGNYLGKKELQTAVEQINAKNLTAAKGLAAEVDVGDLLENYLPHDTYVIAHPQIGRYDPDFIVISPRYGFRVLEVKNWNPSNILNIDSNGTAYFINQQSQNPMSQVKKHRDELWNYLKTNFDYSAATVDCLVIHYGFTKQEFKEKFDNGWDANFYKSTIFRDQLNEDIDNLLLNSSKFINKGIGAHNIQRIVDSIAISDKIFDTEKIKDELADRNEELGKMRKDEKTVKKLVYVVIALLIVSIVGIFKVLPDMQANIQRQDEVLSAGEDTALSIAKILSDDSNVGKEFELLLLVTEFNYDSDSETKFLLLSDGKDSIDGVIFSNTAVPYIEVNNCYNIVGKLNIYNSKYQLIINSVSHRPHG